jgi:penicillin amidase
MIPSNREEFMLRGSHLLLAALAFGGLAVSAGQEQTTGRVEVLRDRWGVPHVFARTEAEAFYGVGYSAAEDRLLQMELFRRRATGRLAEIFGAKWVDSDRKFRIAGMRAHCDDAAASLPEDLRVYLQGYAAGVNAWVRANPEKAQRRLAKIEVGFEPWTEGDCVCAWMAVGELFDPLYNPGAIQTYREFRELAAEIGVKEALKHRGMVIDDAAAIVPESEMAKDTELYARLKSRPPTPGHWFSSLPDEVLRFSHAWAVGGSRSVTGKPILESDPQTTVNNPPLWYEFHLAAGRYDVRGIGVAGCPGMLVGFNRQIAWGATALGAGSAVTFLEKRAPGGEGYLFGDAVLPFDRRVETIQVKGGAPVAEEVLRTRHGFVFDALAGNPQPDEAYVSHYRPIEEKGTSVLGMLGMMAAGNWFQFRDAMQYYYSPGIHVVYADRENNIGYQTLVNVPLTQRTRRMALEGWHGRDEVAGRIPLDEMPHMLNPDAGFISHANNLPVGSWYPYDLGISTGGTGHSSRSLRLVELLSGDKKFSVETFESEVHRDDVNANTAALFPVARRLAEQMRVSDRGILDLLNRLKDWDLRFRADQPAYPAALALGEAALLPFRRSPLSARLGGGEGGISHLARLVRAQFGGGDSVPQDPEVRAYLMDWLRSAAAGLAQNQGRAPAPGQSREFHRMPYQTNGPLGFPALDASLELTSPALSCTHGATIWSQTGNSYTQIVDLADVDNSRAVLPPGISEDPESPFYASQMSIWAKGETRPAPLSREKLEEFVVSRITLEVEPYAAAAAR